MIYESREEQERVENIMSRLEFAEVTEKEERENYSHCKATETVCFAEEFGQDAGDIIMLSLLFLYDKGNEAPQTAHFRFTKEDGTKVQFIVLNEGKTAVFTLDDQN